MTVKVYKGKNVYTIADAQPRLVLEAGKLPYYEATGVVTVKKMRSKKHE